MVVEGEGRCVRAKGKRKRKQKRKEDGKEKGDEPMYLLNAYPVFNETLGSGPIGSSGTLGEAWPLPMHVLTELVKAIFFGLPA